MRICTQLWARVWSLQNQDTQFSLSFLLPAGLLIFRCNRKRWKHKKGCWLFESIIRAEWLRSEYCKDMRVCENDWGRHQGSASRVWLCFIEWRGYSINVGKGFNSLLLKEIWRLSYFTQSSHKTQPSGASSRPLSSWSLFCPTLRHG